MPTIKRTYTAFFEEAEEGGFVVFVPALPGCNSEGDTYPEAVFNICQAIQAWVDSACAHEGGLPEDHVDDLDAPRIEMTGITYRADIPVPCA
jgi:predicted RNase H-like HicB family nuclease